MFATDFFLWPVTSITRPESTRSRNEEYPFGLLRITASGLWRQSGGADHYGNKETQKEQGCLHAV